MTCERIPYEDAKIRFLIKLPQVFLSIVENETTVAKHSEMVYVRCTALEVGSDDVAPSHRVGVWIRRQSGRREGSRVVRVIASY